MRIGGEPSDGDRVCSGSCTRSNWVTEELVESRMMGIESFVQLSFTRSSKDGSYRGTDGVLFNSHVRGQTRMIVTGE